MTKIQNEPTTMVSKFKDCVYNLVYYADCMVTPFQKYCLCVKIKVMSAVCVDLPTTHTQG